MGRLFDKILNTINDHERLLEETLLMESIDELS